MAILEAAQKILAAGYICDNCLGRQFAQLLSGYTNRERGAAIRTALAMNAEAGGANFPENFRDIKFRILKSEKKIIPSVDGKLFETNSKTGEEKRACRVCNGLFGRIDELASKVASELSGIEFGTFHVGVTLSKELLENEEALWETAGIDYCESIKTEISREAGKKLSANLKKEVDLKNPEVVVLLNFERNAVELTISPMYVRGKYKKFAKIPQTTWYCHKCQGRGCDSCGWRGRLAKTSVEEIVAEPFILVAKGTGAKFHGAGREDADVLCLDWRDFVLEILEPRVRRFDLKKIRLRKADAKKVAISGLSFAKKEDIIAVKEAKSAKTYRMIVELEKPVKKEDLKALGGLKATISQRTPERVARRRADKIRKRRVLAVKCRLLGKKKIELQVRTEAGLYVKELVTGDQGRTKPSVSGLLGVAAKVKEMSVVGIG